MVCCNGSSPGSGWGYGGWVRRMVRENLQGTYRDLKLYKYRVDSGRSTSDLNQNVARVLAKVTGTMDMNGECCDGCIAKVDGAAMPGVASPHLSCVYSAIVNRSYLYRRDFGSTSFTLLGQAGADQLIGNGADLTCEHLGISSKSATGNYIYLLGKNEINAWMDAAAVPPAMKLRELTDVAVSDQWWQTGGIVYAYDKQKGKVYSFVRKENSASGHPDEIDVSDGGILPDSIGADGFGSLYMLKTEYDPPNKSFFTDGAESSRVATGNYFQGTSQKIFKAVFKQNVYKSVYKRAYDTGRITKERNSILLGTNTFQRLYLTDDNDPNSKKVWLESDYTQIAPIIDANIRTEIAVINSPTPPRPTNINAITDCIGPMSLGATGFVKAVPGSDGKFTSDQNLYFLVENAPYFDANDLNVGSVGEDVDGDGRIGRFPNTISKTHIKYNWKIIRTHDREGNKVDETDSANLLVDTEGNYLLSFPSNLEGEFKVGVKVSYGYYDYSQLPVGALASAKDSVLVTGKVATGEDTAGYAWEKIKMRLVPKILSATDKGIIMVGTNAPTLNTYKPGAGIAGYGCGSNCGHAACSKNEQNPETTNFIMDGHSLVRTIKKSTAGDTYTSEYETDSVINWGMRVRETKYNLNRGIDRIASMTSAAPPKPNDPQLVPDTLKWENDLQVTWKSELLRGAEVIYTDQFIGTQPVLLLDQLRRLMPFPSEPLRYKISMSMSRRYMYEYYNQIPKYVGGVFTGSYDYLRVPKSIAMDIWAEAEVCVTDNSPPYPFVYNAAYTSALDRIVPAYALNKTLLYATTGEPLTKHNSGSLEFIVADNNPMANYTGVAPLSNGSRDLYHYTSSAPYNRLGVSFALANRTAVLNYESQNGRIPVATDASMKNLYTATPVVPTKAEIESAGLVYSKVLAYQKYTYAISKFAHCSKRLDDATQWSANLPLDYANNKSGYSNYKYGIEWKEACYSANNNLSIEPQTTGHIVIRDNDRPNAFITALQDKYFDTLCYAPSGFSTAQMPPAWRKTVDDDTSGPENWYKDDGGSIKNDFRYMNFDSATVVDTKLFTDAMKLEVDVPVRFGALMSDNVGTVSTHTFRLEDSSGAVLYDAKNVAKLPMQYVFRKPGTYAVVLIVEDNALDWPSTANAFNNPSVASPLPNTRRVRAVFEVVPTRLEFRYIDRQNKGR
jgi:hypothetical protein